MKEDSNNVGCVVVLTMDFKLNFSFSPSPEKMGLDQAVMLMGSCFAEHIGSKLASHKFDALTNPYGILFNPLSIAIAFKEILENKKYDEQHLFPYNGLWHSWQHHGIFSAAHSSTAINSINAAITSSRLALMKSDWIIISFGSAWVYERKESGVLAANCHKVPASHFNKRLLRVSEIIGAYETLLNHQMMQQKRFVFTVSPVRYIRDGLVENNHSKAVLIRALHELVSQQANAYYFPAYEIVLDELRDYRFFERDLVHPNQLAIDYVWKRFSETYFSSLTQNLVKEIAAICTALAHKPMNEESEEHIKFKQTLYKRVLTLQEQWPVLDFSKELMHFKS